LEVDRRWQRDRAFRGHPLVTAERLFVVSLRRQISRRIAVPLSSTRTAPSAGHFQHFPVRSGRLRRPERRHDAKHPSATDVLSTNAIGQEEGQKAKEWEEGREQEQEGKRNTRNKRAAEMKRRA
jgi:hypothetical protein